MRKTKALICGISGQDGAYLARLLLQKGYEVVGTTRDLVRADFVNLRALGILELVRLRSMLPSNRESVSSVIASECPDEVYNLSGQTSVSLSFSQPIEALESISVGTLNLLEALKEVRTDVKFFNACSSECFGDTESCGADERTPFRPRSPYAIAKAEAYWQVADYRSAYGMFACSGILFNHESPLRPETFVTRKIIRGVLMVSRREIAQLELGNLSISRDWGWAPDYVDAMWRILQQALPGDFVIATGRATTLKDFLALAFEKLGLDWRQHVVVNPAFMRPLDVNFSIGNPTKAADLLDWRSSTSVEEIVSQMLAAENRAMGSK
jgi:GDPmannose 4,6-dehydratase